MARKMQRAVPKAAPQKSTIPEPSSSSAADLKTWYEANKTHIENFAKAEQAARQLRDITKTATKSISTFSRETLRTYLQNLGSNEKNLRSLSWYLYYRSQIYARLVSFNSDMFCLDIYIFYNLANLIDCFGYHDTLDDLVKGGDPTKMLKSYNDTLNHLERMNLQGEMQNAYRNCFIQDVFYAIVVLFFAVACSEKVVETPELELWYRTPAKIWEESLPLGNGRLGAMPTGGVYSENIVLNDITMWSGSFDSLQQNPNAQKYLPKIRSLLLDGKNKQAQDLVYKYFLCGGKGSGAGSGANVPYGSYQLLGNLRLTYHFEDDLLTDYRRGLVLDDATAYTSFMMGKTHFFREYFVSQSEDVVVIKLSASKKGKIAFEATLNRPRQAKIFVEIFNLFSIDELDMTLHSAALKRFISIINQKAIEKKLQVFFTSHRPELMDIPEIHAFYIMHRNNTTICLDNPTSNCYEELTGHIEKPLVIFLEDKFSKEISRKTLMDLNLLQRANITSVGTYHNCIVMLYATICQIHDQEMTAPDPINADNRTENKIKDCIAILDGDVTLDELNTKINHIITGTDPITVKRKNWVRSQILQYNSQPSTVQNNKNMCPEEFIHDTFARIPNPSSSIIIESNRVILPDNDPHKYFTNLLDTNTFTIESIINEFATTGAWGNYINPIKVWAEVQKRTHGF